MKDCAILGDGVRRQPTLSGKTKRWVALEWGTGMLDLKEETDSVGWTDISTKVGKPAKL